MFSHSSWIIGLMRENYEAVGFIPETTVRDRYVRKGWYVFQHDERGRPVGYLLHGAIRIGQPAIISQHCIQYERRLAGYGRAAFDELRRRCERIGASSIHLRVAENLPSVLFWQSCGFSVDQVVNQHNRRSRLILEMSLRLDLPLLEGWS